MKSKGACDAWSRLKQEGGALEPCALPRRASRPLQTTGRRRGTLPVWITRSAPWFPRNGGVTDGPRLVLHCLLHAAEPWPGPESQSAEGFAAKNARDFASRYCGVAAKPRPLCSTTLRLGLSMAMGNPGLACPVSFPTISRSNQLLVGAFHNSCHNKPLHMRQTRATLNSTLFPAIHRIARGRRRGTWSCSHVCLVLDSFSLAFAVD